jgi:hypothetical protein
MQAAIPGCGEQPNRHRANSVKTLRQFKAATRTVNRQYGHGDGLVQHSAVSEDLCGII